MEMPCEHVQTVEEALQASTYWAATTRRGTIASGREGGLITFFEQQTTCLANSLNKVFSKHITTTGGG